jgi:adenosylhomocysteine nucleosidase
MRNAFIVSAVLLIGMLLTGCSGQGQKTRAADSLELHPVIVQGAMDLEVKKFASRLDNVSVEKVGGWTFWRGTLDGYPVVVSRS